MATCSSKHLLVAAFDFGTTYSGYGFSFRNDPLKVQTNHGWNAGSEKLISLKTPTCVLLKPNKEFHSFGFEAENKYTGLAEDDQHEGWLLFRRFKMILHNNEHLSRRTTVDDINGVSMPAMSIFSMAICYLRDHFLEALNKQTTGVEETDIQYILTVPAIWSDNAKQFMREAAVEAGMDEKRFKLCLEPEAASIWCQIITTDIKAALSKAGTQYMVVDLGGGTADVSVHEKQIDNSLKELHRPSGGPWGGNAVDNNYLDWLTKIFGRPTMNRFKTEQMADYFDLFREFETKKRTVSCKSEGKMTFRVSASLKEIYQDVVGVPLKDKVAAEVLSEMVTFTGDKLRIDASIVKSWFDAPVDRMITHVKQVLGEKKMQHVNTILLVGGFAESLMVQEEMQRKIQNKRISIPDEAGLVVLKGAVRFGHIPDIITTRMMPFTYGIAVKQIFDESKHVSSKKINEQGQDYARGIFKIHVHVGEETTLGKEYCVNVWLCEGNKTTKIKVYRSSNLHPNYVTDDDCKLLGNIDIDSSESRSLIDKAVAVTLVFGDTEILVKVKIRETGKEFTKYIDCL